MKTFAIYHVRNSEYRDLKFMGIISAEGFTSLMDALIESENFQWHRPHRLMRGKERVEIIELESEDCFHVTLIDWTDVFNAICTETLDEASRGY